MNIGALQSMMAMKKVSTNNTQKSGAETAKFGAIFSGISSKAPEVKPPTDAEVPTEFIPKLFNASTLEELKEVLQGILDDENVEQPMSIQPLMNGAGNLKEFAEGLSLTPEEILKNLQQLLERAGMSKIETEELSVTMDMWTLLNIIEEAGVQFFDKLNESLEMPAARKEAVQLLAFIKSLELTAPKNDMLISMEQKVDSFRHMMTSAAGQFDQRMATLGKQDQLPFIQQKTDIRVVIETNSATSANTEGSRQNQADISTPPASSTVTQVRAELTVQQSESNPSNRSESFMRDMQALMKRANFGQVGGTNRMLIKLYPEHLGQIRIELLETNGIMTARILASTAFAKGMLDSQLHQLKHAFNQQNLQVERIDITQTIQESQRNEREQSFNEQFKREQQANDKNHNKSSEEERSFEEFLIEMEV